MLKGTPSPLIIDKKGQARTIERLPKAHEEFDERYLQELLIKHPELLPINQLRDDVGRLLCIGREVPVGSSGAIDNLYLSTGGYPVIVETKLWRNPQARREVLSQVLDYIKEISSKDFEWFEKTWHNFSKTRYGKQANLVSELDAMADDELDARIFVDRVNRALSRGDILAMIVGDGIETRLQQLVSHLCKDSAHLRYSLALVELACYRMNNARSNSDMLVVPKIIQEIEPVQRAYVRIDLAPGLDQKLIIDSATTDESQPKASYNRTILSEEDFINELDRHVGVALRKKIEQFYRELIHDFDLEPDFKSAAVMLKVPDPSGEKPGASLLGIERQGRIYNSGHIKGQLKGWGLSEEEAKKLAFAFWADLHKIDPRFPANRGISHMSPRSFLPIIDLVDKFEDIKSAVGRAVARIRQETGEH